VKHYIRTRPMNVSDERYGTIYDVFEEGRNWPDGSPRSRLRVECYWPRDRMGVEKGYIGYPSTMIEDVELAKALSQAIAAAVLELDEKRREQQEQQQ